MSPNSAVTASQVRSCKVAVLWIDWYAYHLARFRGLLSAPTLAGHVAGIELVGGVGVHAGLKFREDLPADLPIHTLMPGSSWSEAGQLRLALKVWQYLGRLDPDAVLVPGYYTLPALAAALWARLHQRTSILMTESTADDHARVPWKESAKSLLIPTLFDSAITGGRAHRRYLDQLGFSSHRIARFYDVVDNSSLAAETAALRLRPPQELALPRPYFLYVGRLAAEKNVGGLVAAWIAYRESGGTWPLVLVGDGPEAASLRTLVGASRFADDGHFAGHRSSHELPLFYAFAGCFVLPSTREPWGLVVNEAMAAGLPVIVSTRCGCAEDLVEPSGNGFVFDPADPAQLAARLHAVSGLTPEHLDAMGRRSSELIGPYSLQNFGLEVARLTDLVKEQPVLFVPGNNGPILR